MFPASLCRQSTGAGGSDVHRLRSARLRDNGPMGLRFAAGLLCGFCMAMAQTDVPPQVLLLSRIKQHMKDRLLQVPNYTCLETVERLEQLSRANKFKPVDTGVGDQRNGKPG